MEMKWIMTLDLRICKLKKKNQKQICLKTVYDNLLFTDKKVSLFLFFKVK